MRFTSLFLPFAIVGSTSTAFAQNTCSSPAVLTCDSQAFFYDTGNASASGLNPGCGGSNPVDLWYEITPTGSGLLDVSTCGSIYDTRLAIWADDCSTVLACNDDDNSLCSGQSSSLSRVTINATAGTTYLIQVGGFNSVSGAGVLNVDPPCCTTQNYCVSGANGATIALTPGASTSVAANNFSLDAYGLPNTNGIFYYGASQSSLPFGGGFSCVSGSIFRLDIVGTPVGGTRTLAIDLNQAPATNITPGSCWNFQYLFRDSNATGGFDLTDGLSVNFQ